MYALDECPEAQGVALSFDTCSRARKLSCK